MHYKYVHRAFPTTLVSYQIKLLSSPQSNKCSIGSNWTYYHMFEMPISLLESGKHELWDIHCFPVQLLLFIIYIYHKTDCYLLEDLSYIISATLAVIVHYYLFRHHVCASMCIWMCTAYCRHHSAAIIVLPRDEFCLYVILLKTYQ